MVYLSKKNMVDLSMANDVRHNQRAATRVLPVPRARLVAMQLRQRDPETRTLGEILKDGDAP